MAEATSGYIAFRPRARLLKLIGAELISDEVVAITELVKNAHDADASTVKLRFLGVREPGTGVIEIVDDGCGMDLETFRGGWMEPAGSTKADDASKVTPRGRRVLGEKGVGRFAADKLGRHLELISRKAGHNAEVRASFDWDQFDSDDQMLSDVRNRWELRPAAEIKAQGTILRITGLRDGWSERTFRRLSTRLARLQSPFGSTNGFTIEIESDEFPAYAGELRSSIFDKAPYGIDLRFDGRDTFRIELCGKRSTVPASAGAGQLGCGPVHVRLHAFDLETEAIARIGPRMEVRAWLREWSGVSVYRDGFRIWPYGEPHDDWLRLDQRRVNNPVVRLSNNQVVGFVEITRDGNPELLDQTNREGLIHNQAFDDLRKVLEFSFQTLEAERQKIRHPASGSRKERRRRRPGQLQFVEALDRLAKGEASSKRDLKRLAAEAKANAERHQFEMHRLIEGYNDLAAAGLAATYVGASLRAGIEKLRHELAALERPSGRRSAKAFAGIKVELDRLESQLEMLGTLAASGGQRRRTMDVQEELQGFRDSMSPSLQQRGIAFQLAIGGTPMQRVDMHPGVFRRILHILLSNSVDWLIRTDQPRVTISCTAAEHHCEVLFSDNGPGIAPTAHSRVFEPLFSTKEGGRGMGLTVAKGLVEQHGGKIAILRDGRRKGTHVLLSLPRKRSRATINER